MNQDSNMNTPNGTNTETINQLYSQRKNNHQMPVDVKASLHNAISEKLSGEKLKDENSESKTSNLLRHPALALTFSVLLIVSVLLNDWGSIEEQMAPLPATPLQNEMLSDTFSTKSNQDSKPMSKSIVTKKPQTTDEQNTNQIQVAKPTLPTYQENETSSIELQNHPLEHQKQREQLQKKMRQSNKPMFNEQQDLNMVSSVQKQQKEFIATTPEQDQSISSVSATGDIGASTINHSQDSELIKIQVSGARMPAKMIEEKQIDEAEQIDETEREEISSNYSAPQYSASTYKQKTNLPELSLLIVININNQQIQLQDCFGQTYSLQQSLKAELKIGDKLVLTHNKEAAHQEKVQEKEPLKNLNELIDNLKQVNAKAQCQ